MEEEEAVAVAVAVAVHDEVVLVGTNPKFSLAMDNKYRILQSYLSQKAILVQVFLYMTLLSIFE